MVHWINKTENEFVDKVHLASICVLSPSSKTPLFIQVIHEIHGTASKSKYLFILSADDRIKIFAVIADVSVTQDWLEQKILGNNPCSKYSVFIYIFFFCLFIESEDGYELKHTSWGLGGVATNLRKAQTRKKLNIFEGNLYYVFPLKKET